jgi:carboxylesterase type B
MFFARRNANIGWSKRGISSYTYRFDVKLDSLPESVGATHFQEVAFVFLNHNGDGYETNPFSGPAAYQQRAKDLSKTMASAWVNFVVRLDPNGGNGNLADGGSSWPVYNTSVGDGVGEELVWSLNGTYIDLDDYRKDGMEWMMDHMLSVFGA